MACSASRPTARPQRKQCRDTRMPRSYRKCSPRAAHHAVRSNLARKGAAKVARGLRSGLKMQSKSSAASEGTSCDARARGPALRWRTHVPSWQDAILWRPLPPQGAPPHAAGRCAAGNERTVNVQPWTAAGDSRVAAGNSGFVQTFAKTPEPLNRSSSSGC